MAIDAHNRATAAGIQDTPATRNALCLVYASAGDLPRAVEQFDSLFDSGQLQTLGHVASSQRGQHMTLAHHDQLGDDSIKVAYDMDSVTTSRDEDTTVATLLHACIQAGVPERAVTTFESFRKSGCFAILISLPQVADPRG